MDRADTNMDTDGQPLPTQKPKQEGSAALHSATTTKTQEKLAGGGQAKHTEEPAHVPAVDSSSSKQEGDQINVKIYYDGIFAFKVGVPKSCKVADVRTKISNYLAKKGAVVIKFHGPKVGAIDPDAEDENKLDVILGEGNRVDLKPEGKTASPLPGGVTSNANPAPLIRYLSATVNTGWRLERCNGFVPKEAWAFDPTMPPVRVSVRSSVTNDGFPFDNAYFGVWRGAKARIMLQESIAAKTAIIKAPPYSSKTSLMQAIAIEADKAGHKVFPVTCTSFLSPFETYTEKKGSDILWKKSISDIFDIFWQEETGYSFAEWNTLAAKNAVILLLDEIQVLYEYDLENLFWSRFRVWPLQQVTVIAAAVYSAQIVVRQLSGHIQWGKQYFIEDLKFSSAEMKILGDRFNQCNKYSKTLLPSRAATWLEDNLGRHVGFSREFLDGLEDFAKESGLQGDSVAAKYIVSTKGFQKITATRGYPTATQWNDEMRLACAILLPLTPVGSFEELRTALSSIKNVMDMAVYPLLKLGVLTLYDASTIDFSSPVMRYLCAKELVTTSNLAVITNIDSLVVEIVRRLDASTLQKAFNLSRMRDGHLGEPIWRSELHRATRVCLDTNKHTVTPEVGHIVHGLQNPVTGEDVEISGLVDFYINGSYCWAIEVMREGCGIGEHLGRFEPDGMYVDLDVKDYRVIDFRHHTKGVRLVDQHLITVHYNDDFTEFTISGGQLRNPEKVYFVSASQPVKRDWWPTLPKWWG